MRYVGTELDGVKESYVCTNYRAMFTIITITYKTSKETSASKRLQELSQTVKILKAYAHKSKFCQDNWLADNLLITIRGG